MQPRAMSKVFLGHAASKAVRHGLGGVRSRCYGDGRPRPSAAKLRRRDSPVKSEAATADSKAGAGGPSGGRGTTAPITTGRAPQHLRRWEAPKLTTESTGLTAGGKHDA